MSLKIISLPPDRWKEFKKLRLGSLESDPLAFGETYEQEAIQPDSYWINFLKRSNGTKGSPIVLVAEEGGKIVGRGIVFLGIPQRVKHVGRIRGMYIKKEYRGKGIAKELLRALIDTAFSRHDVEKIKLTVNETQENAIRLYRKFGFKVVGTLKKEFKVDGKHYDAYIMELLR